VLGAIRRVDICFGPVDSIAEKAADPQLRHRELIVAIDDPTRGKHWTLGLPIKPSETEIARFRKSGVV
jgi:crotonobetainyl-CoA:carnitine CoA-transferase CaiB-like acyl-CoA transferase